MYMVSGCSYSSGMNYPALVVTTAKRLILYALLRHTRLTLGCCIVFRRVLNVEVKSQLEHYGL